MNNKKVSVLIFMCVLIFILSSCAEDTSNDKKINTAPVAGITTADNTPDPDIEGQPQETDEVMPDTTSDSGLDNIEVKGGSQEARHVIDFLNPANPEVLDIFFKDRKTVLEEMGSGYSISDVYSGKLYEYTDPKYKNIVFLYNGQDELSAIRFNNNENQYRSYPEMRLKADVDKDGKLENVIYYNGVGFPNRFVVYKPENGKILCDKTVEEEYSAIEPIQLDEGDLEILAWSDSDYKIIKINNGDSINPPETQYNEELKYSLHNDKAVIEMGSLKIDCYLTPMLGKIIELNSPNPSRPLFNRQSHLSVKKSEDKKDYFDLTTSIGVYISDVEYIDGSRQSRYSEVAQIVESFRYDNGVWLKADEKIKDRYSKSLNTDIKLNYAWEMGFGDIVLANGIFDLIDKGLVDKRDDPISLECTINSLEVSVNNYRICYIGAKSPSNVTNQGIKVGDSAQKVIEAYGIPDKRMKNDSEWTYYLYRFTDVKKWDEAGYIILCDDYMTFRFNEAGAVEEICMSAYIPID
ncbi:MAG: hypothetical protein GX660_27695 [Clostridiaceae bacterium]|nr:hypothetical protein [Clostridiaceae bacterium]